VNQLAREYKLEDTLPELGIFQRGQIDLHLECDLLPLHGQVYFNQTVCRVEKGATNQQRDAEIMQI